MTQAEHDRFAEMRKQKPDKATQDGRRRGREGTTQTTRATPLTAGTADAVDTASIEDLCASHYSRVGPLLEASLGRIPVVSASFPHGFDKPAQWHVSLHDPPPAVATVQATTPSGTHTYLALHDRALAWATHALGSVEFYSWTPCPDDFERPAFGRMLLKPAGSTPPQTLRDAAHILRQELQRFDLDAIVMLGGGGGIAIWLPVTDTTYAVLSAWLHTLAARVANAHPNLFVTEPHAHGDGLVRIAVAKNAPGTFTAVPYCARGSPQLPVCLPVRWDELDTIGDGSVTVETLPARLEVAGDIFALEKARIGPQSLKSIAALNAPAPQLGVRGHGHILATALDILSDGKLRSAPQILSEAIERKLLPPNFSHKYLYTALTQYIERCRGAGRKPAILQDEERNFRVNEPLDDWPALPGDADPACPEPGRSVQTQGLIDRLEKTATGSDPAAFEIAVCDAFAHLGFATAHLGGDHAPDGYADAQLGALGYRAMLECKTAKSTAHDPDVFEAAKFRDAFHAQYCALVGPAFPEELKLTSELHTHGVSAWTLSDLRTALTIGANAHELRACFDPGYAADALADLIWERRHGLRKRVLTVANLIRSTGWHLQIIAGSQRVEATMKVCHSERAPQVCHSERAPLGAPVEPRPSGVEARVASTNGAPRSNGASIAPNAPMLTLDAAMVLVDEALALAGSRRACTREETELAFEYLTNPIVGHATWTDTSQTSIVIVSP
jgi:DNA primase